MGAMATITLPGTPGAAPVAGPVVLKVTDVNARSFTLRIEAGAQSPKG